LKKVGWGLKILENSTVTLGEIEMEADE